MPLGDITCFEDRCFELFGFSANRRFRFFGSVCGAGDVSPPDEYSVAMRLPNGTAALLAGTAPGFRLIDVATIAEGRCA